MASLVLIREIMSKDVKVVRPDTTAQEIVATMNKFDISSIIVVQGERPVGIITARDILVRLVERCLAPSALTVKHIMTSPLVANSESATIEEAARSWQKRKSRRYQSWTTINLVV